MPAGNQFTAFDSANIIADFYPRLEAAMEKQWAMQISLQVPSDRQTEELRWLGHVPIMRRWIGGRKEEQLNKYTLSVTNYPYEVSIPVSTSDLRRDKTGQVAHRILNDLVARTATHWNSLVGTYIANGAGSTSGLAYDGQFFFDTDHNESGTNQTNNLTATEVPSADVATATTLTPTEAANIISETLAYLMGLTDDRGEPINQNITKLTIFCTKVGHYSGMRQAVGLTNLGTAAAAFGNPVNAWQSVQIDVQFVPQRVTAVNAIYFFIQSPEMGATPFIRTEELAVRLQILGEGSDETFKNDRIIVGVDTQRGLAYGQWQRATKVTLS